MKYFNTMLLTLLPVAMMLTGFCLADTAPGFEHADSSRIILPVMIHYSDNGITPFVNVTVNGKQYKAIFDSGSSGLRMMSGALAANTADTTLKNVGYTYGDNAHALSLRGRAIKALVSFNNIRNSGAQVNIMRIDSEKNGPQGNWISTGDSAVISSGHFRDCSIILGVGLRGSSGGVISPFRQLYGNGKFIVLFPGYGDTKGSVIINPSPGDQTGFVYFKLLPVKSSAHSDANSWLDNKLPGCIAVNNHAATCLPTLLDTGNDDVEVFSTRFDGRQSIPSFNYVTLSIGDPTDTAYIKTSFTIGENRIRGKDYINLDNTQKVSKMIFGLRFFFEFDVLYDQQNGMIGIREKLHKN